MVLLGGILHRPKNIYFKVSVPLMCRVSDINFIGFTCLSVFTNPIFHNVANLAVAKNWRVPLTDELNKPLQA